MVFTTVTPLMVCEIAASLAFAVAFATLGGAILALLLGLFPSEWTLAARDSAYKRLCWSVDLFATGTGFGVFALVIGSFS